MTDDLTKRLRDCAETIDAATPGRQAFRAMRPAPALLREAAHKIDNLMDLANLGQAVVQYGVDLSATPELEEMWTAANRADWSESLGEVTTDETPPL